MDQLGVQRAASRSTGKRGESGISAVSAFPERVVGSACTSSFSRLARRSLALRPAHSRGHQFVARYTEGFSHLVTSMTAPVASGWSGCRVGLAPTRNRRLSRRTPNSVIGDIPPAFGKKRIRAAPCASARPGIRQIAASSPAAPWSPAKQRLWVWPTARSASGSTRPRRARPRI